MHLLTGLCGGVALSNGGSWSSSVVDAEMLALVSLHIWIFGDFTARSALLWCVEMCPHGLTVFVPAIAAPLPQDAAPDVHAAAGRCVGGEQCRRRCCHGQNTLTVGLPWLGCQCRFKQGCCTL